MNKNAIIIKRSKKLRVVTKEINKKTGEAYCVFKEGGTIIQKTLIEPGQGLNLNSEKLEQKI
jgi:hypothetical protein